MKLHKGMNSLTLVREPGDVNEVWFMLEQHFEQLVDSDKLRRKLMQGVSDE